MSKTTGAGIVHRTCRSGATNEITEPDASANAGRAFRLQSDALGPAWRRSTFDMSAKRSLLLAAAFGIGLIGLLLFWPAPRQQEGGLSISFVGLTNDSSGKLLAQFSVANHFSRRVRFGVCEIQFYQTNGWPDWGRDAGAGGGWLAVAAGGERAFSVPTPPLEGVNWRVPLTYQQDLSLIDNVRSRVDGLAWAMPRWRPGKPLPVRHGDSFHRTSCAYGPEMLGGVEPGGAANRSQPVSPRTNRTSAAAGSGR